MTVFTAADLRGVVVGEGQFEDASASTLHYRADVDFVATAGPGGVAVQTPSSYVDIDFFGDNLSVTPASPRGVPGPMLTGGTLTGFAEYDTHGQLILTADHVLQSTSPLDLGIGFIGYEMSGDDQITGSSFTDAINGGDGNDSIRGMDGDDTVNGGAGNDDVNGNMGQDWVYGGDGADSVRGGQGNDTVHGDAGDDGHVNGNLGDDVVHGDDGNDMVYGGQGNDSVFGDAGNDTVSGDLGNDTVSGGPGSDILYGGPGADHFAFAKGFGQDWVADFNAAEGDKISLPAGTTYTVESYQGQVVIDLGGGDTLGLAGVPFATFSTDWVVFS